jgi:hypothetical protein
MPNIPPLWQERGTFEAEQPHSGDPLRTNHSN